MSNRVKAAPKVYKFETFRKEADKKREASENKRVPAPPFRLDIGNNQVIEITEPDTLERQLTVAGFVDSWRRGEWEVGATIPLLRAMCGDNFGPVWMLVKDDPDPAALTELITAMFDHFNDAFKDVVAATDLPGGSTDSSD